MGSQGERARPLAAWALAALCALALGACSPGNGDDDATENLRPVALPPANGKLFGFNSALALWAVDARAEVGLERALGARAQRYGVSWRQVQPLPGVPPFAAGNPQVAGQVARLDRLYRELVRHRMTPVITVSDAPAWATALARCKPTQPACAAQVQAGSLAPDRAHRGDWARYVTAVARRYPKAVIEPWNEPNFSSFWRPGRPDPRAMAALQCSAYRAVKRVSRGRTVLSPGFAVATEVPQNGSVAFPAYADAFLRAGGGRCYDAMSAHVYGGNEAAVGDGSIFGRELEALRRARRDHGDRSPVWITETGGTSVPGQLDEKAQSELNLRYLDRLISLPEVKVVLFNTLRDARDPQLRGRVGEPNYHYGFLRESFRPKPTYCAFARRADARVRGC